MNRIPYWNISYGIIIDLLAVPALAIFIYGLFRQWKRIRQGQALVNPALTGFFEKIGPIYLKPFLVNSILGLRIYNKIFTGIAHGCLFWGMVLLLAGTGLVFLNVLFDLPVFGGGFNRWFMCFTLDLAGLASFGGIVFMLIRRLWPPERLTIPQSRPNTIPIIIILGFVIVSGFLVEAFRIASNGFEQGAFIGNGLAFLLDDFHGALAFHKYSWWLHGLLALIFISYIPYSSLVHIVLAPVNTALSDPAPGIKMGVVDFSAFEAEEAEEMPSLGVAKLNDFSRKRLLDFSTCLWCGRCHEVCPAAQTGKSLSPKGVIVVLAEFLSEEKFEDESLADSITSEAIFSCTTCAACQEVCPVSINQPKIILKLRQNLVMERSQIPELLGKANNSLEQRRHPFFGAGCGPKDWRKDLEVPFFEADKTEYLLWIGCAIAFEERAQNTARAMVNVLQQAGVSFGILENVRCTGDPAKQMGNEFMFTELAGQNIEEFSSLGIQKIITMCPHCYNSFFHYYPELGGNYEVISHAVFIKILIDSGKLNLKKSSQTIAYHDPCYLARHNDILNEPRRVISAAANLTEMPRNRKDSFCCGGGGGNYWAEEKGTRINQTRAREALDTGAEKIATACPFCLLMITDGLKKFTEDEKAFDIAEIVEKQMVAGAGSREQGAG
ncbi:MAG: fumarate reductase subunit, partial [Deltaproteobacteria bacterium CG1_02_45_11]